MDATATILTNKTHDNNASAARFTAFKLPEQIRVKYRSSYVKGTVYNAVTKQPLKADIELIDLKQQQTISQVQSDSINGQYLMVLTEGADYALYVNKGEFPIQKPDV